MLYSWLNQKEETINRLYDSTKVVQYQDQLSDYK
jgi:hypothetical protein